MAVSTAEVHRPISAAPPPRLWDGPRDYAGALFRRTLASLTRGPPFQLGGRERGRVTKRGAAMLGRANRRRASHRFTFSQSLQEKSQFRLATLAAHSLKKIQDPSGSKASH